jgi:hypothetical protein
MKRWTFLTAILIAIFNFSGNSFGQGHFVLSYTGNGQDQMNINVVEANIGGVALEAGDEIAAFDGTFCCGKTTLVQPILFSNPGTFVSIAASKADVGVSNGYTVGHPITIKFWDSSKRKEMSGITANFINTSGATITAPTYTVGVSAFVKLSVAALPNQTPVSNAGVDQSINEGVIVTLDGTGSSDPDYDALKYSWTAPVGITLSSTTSSKPTFTAPQVSVNTNYTFSLVVNDGTVNSVADQVIVTVKQVNQPTTSKTLGNTETFISTNVAANRRAMPVTFNEEGEIQSISIYHDGGTGNVLLGVYSDQAGLPSSQLGVSAATVVNTSGGWQTVTLASPVSVTSGQTVWLAWVFQNSVTVRYTAGTPGRALSSATWSSGMPATFGNSTTGSAKYSVYCTYKPAVLVDLGNSEIFVSTNVAANRRAMPVTFNEAGNIQSVSIYHDGGTGNVLMGVYSDQTGLPSSLLGLSSATAVNTAAGWQTVSLTSPVSVTSGQTVWLAWVFQSSVNVRYTAGTPGRAISSASWSTGLPAAFGTSTTAGYKYSIYCTYIAGAATQTKSADVVLDIDPSLYETSTEMLIYPNPTKGEVHFKFSKQPEDNSLITVFNSSGSMISKVKAEGQEQSLDLSGNSPGIYLIRIDQKDDSKTYKVLLR